MFGTIRYSKIYWWYSLISYIEDFWWIVWHTAGSKHRILTASSKVRVVPLTQWPRRSRSQSVLRTWVSNIPGNSCSTNLLLRNDPTPDRGQQLPRAASLIVSCLGFVHDLRAGILEPDTVRGTPLDMDQYTRIFGTARIPTEVCIRIFPYTG